MKNITISTEEEKSKGTAYLLWCAGLLGFCGLHRIYMGKIGTGLLWFFTAGVFGIGQFIDLFILGGRVDRHNLMVRMQNSFLDKSSPDGRSLERFTLSAAHANRGILTPTVLAMVSDMSIDEAEKELQRLRDKGICRMEVSEKGTIEYHFPEFLL